ncbi:MAG TPA: hypothetical protein VFA37_03130 [Gaiellaceae bacterium]|nr:hypothetical protein [Gaiellaceae bacterium]
MARRSFALSGLAGSALAAGLGYRLWRGWRRERVDIYFDDGSFVTFVSGSSGAERLLPLARQVLAAVHKTPTDWPIE